MTQLTADKVRLMMPMHRLQNWIHLVEDLIRNAAKNDKSQIRVPYEVTSSWPTDNGAVPRLDVSPGREFAQHFQKAGFTVKEFYNAGQFVDTGIVISWEDDSSGDEL